MAANTAPIFPLTPYCGNLSLDSVSACTTRAPVATASLSANNIFEFVSTSTNGRKIDRIQVQANSTSVTAASTPQIVQIWIWDTTKAYLIDEIVITSVTPSTTSVAFVTSKAYTNLVLPPTYKLFASTTVATTSSTNAIQLTAFGGDY